MKKLIVLFSLVILGSVGIVLAVFSIPSNYPGPDSIDDYKPATLDVNKINELINDYRSSKGLKRLSFDQSMCAYTKHRLSEIHTDFTHRGFKENPPEFSLPANSYAGENLARGQNSEDELLKDWIKSPSHHASMINPHFTRTCIESDSYNGSTYTIQTFASY